MAHIQSIPLELLIRIFTIVCERDYIPYHGYLSKPRHLKSSLVPVVRVCKSWRDITLSGGFPHLWTTILRLGDTIFDPCDIILQAYSFRRCLADSQNSDIVVQLVDSSWSDYTTAGRIY